MILCLSEAWSFLEEDYLEIETSHGLAADYVSHITAFRYMSGVRASMIDIDCIHPYNRTVQAPAP